MSPSSSPAPDRRARRLLAAFIAVEFALTLVALRSCAAQVPARALHGVPATTTATGAPRTALALTLDNALARLSLRDPRIEGASAQRAVADARAGEARSALRGTLIPTIAASYTAQRVAQNQFTEIARRAGPIAAPPADAPADPFALVFASPNARTGAVTASIRPFDGGVSLARHGAARSVAAAADDGVTLARAALELAIVTHYADAQLGRRLADVADSALAQAERTLAVTRAAFEAGRVPEYDVVRAEAAVEQQRPAAIEARRGARLAELALRQAITVPDDVALDLVTPLEDGGDAAPDTVIARVAVPRDSAPRRIALRQLAHRVDAADGESRAAWRELLPTIDVQFTHQQLAYPLVSGGVRGPYYPNTTIAAVVSLPIDLTGRALARTEVTAAEARAARADLAEARRAATLEATDLALAIDAAAARWRAGNAAARSAERAYTIAEARHAVGRLSLLELRDARLAMQQALAARAQAARDLMVADARRSRLARLPIAGDLAR